MNTPHPDPGHPDLGDLLHDAVDDIEPADRLGAIRARTADAPEQAGRRWWYAAGGVVLATAAAVAAFAVVGNDGGEEQGNVATEPGTLLVAAYFVGDTERGPRLFREFDQMAGTDPLQAALDRIERPATDPDYRTPWTATSFGSVTLEDGAIRVELGDAVLDDALAVQQVVYTLQGAAQQRLPVWLGDSVYEARPMNAVLNMVNINDPVDGTAYEGAFIARGRANAWEGTVLWELRDDESGRVVRNGSTNAGYALNEWNPWEVEVDLSGLPAGYYTFSVQGDDASAGGEKYAPDSDTRRIIVR
ncbi:hypothetical protein GCM10027062_43600 [Nocardioides hungaricus]